MTYCKTCSIILHINMEKTFVDAMMAINTVCYSALCLVPLGYIGLQYLKLKKQENKGNNKASPETPWRNTTWIGNDKTVKQLEAKGHTQAKINKMNEEEVNKVLYKGKDR